MKRRAVLALIFLALIYTACAPASRADNSVGMAPAQEAGPPSAFPEEAPSFGNVGGEPAQIQRIVIKNADLEIVVRDPAEAMDAVGAMADQMGGFVVTSRLYKTYTDNNVEVPEATITVRVPSERLNEVLAQIKALVENPLEDILSENVTGQDVTKEYTDLQSRLRNLEQTEEQLREIMASATRTEDVLAVYTQLTAVRQEIEVTRGQIQYYDESARLSAVTVQLISQESVAPLTIGGWQPVGVARDAVQALINAVKFLASASIWVVLFFIPVALVILVPLWLVVRLIQRGLARRKTARPGPPPSNTDSPGS